MTKKLFNLFGSAILVISLIYVPTISGTGNGEIIVTTSWAFIFNFHSHQFIDLVRLTIEELAIGVFLFGLWQFVSED